MRKAVAFLLLLLFLTSPSLSGTPKNGAVPFVVESQKLRYDDSRKVAVYVGSVVAQHGSTVITGDRLTVYFDPTGRHIRKVVVEGNVHIRDPRGEGWCNKLIYYPIEDKVVLTGNAELKQKENVIVGDRIVAYRSGRVEVEGIRQKVKTVIYPQEREVGESKRP